MSAIVKLTDTEGCTHGGMQWGPGVRHRVRWRGKLCAPGVLHAYEGITVRDALALALMMDPIQAGYGPQGRAWVCVWRGRLRISDSTKSGFASLMTVQEIIVPMVPAKRRVQAAIRVSLEVCAQPWYVAWAEGWLDGSDRSATAVNKVRAELMTSWQKPAARAARAATRAAARAARAAEAAQEAEAAARAVKEAAWAVWVEAAGSVEVPRLLGSILLPDYPLDGQGVTA